MKVRGIITSDCGDMLMWNVVILVMFEVDASPVANVMHQTFV